MKKKKVINSYNYMQKCSEKVSPDVSSKWLESLKDIPLSEPDDINLYTDEELKEMYPLTNIDYLLLTKYPYLKDTTIDDEVLYLEIEEEIKEVKEEIEYCEDALNKRLNYMAETELKSDLLHAQRKLIILEKQKQEISDKYEGRNRSLSRRISQRS